MWGAQTHHTIIKELAVCVWAKKSCAWTYQTDYSWQPANSSAYRFHTTLTNRATSNREYVWLKAANITGEQAEAKKKERNCTTWVKSWIRKQKALAVFFRVSTHAPIHLAEHCCLKSRWQGTTQQLGPQTFTNICQWPTFSQVYQDPCRHYPNIKTMFPLKLDKTYRMLNGHQLMTICQSSIRSHKHGAWLDPGPQCFKCWGAWTDLRHLTITIIYTAGLWWCAQEPVN